MISPTSHKPRLCDLIGQDLKRKYNGLLDKVGLPLKDTTIVFGHVHLPIDLILGGYRILADPRGYRGIRCDGSAWPGKFASFLSTVGSVPRVAIPQFFCTSPPFQHRRIVLCQNFNDVPKLHLLIPFLWDR